MVLLTRFVRCSFLTIIGSIRQQSAPVSYKASAFLPLMRHATVRSGVFFCLLRPFATLEQNSATVGLTGFPHPQRNPLHPPHHQKQGLDCPPLLHSRSLVGLAGCHGLPYLLCGNHGLSPYLQGGPLGDDLWGPLCWSFHLPYLAYSGHAAAPSRRGCIRMMCDL